MDFDDEMYWGRRIRRLALALVAFGSVAVDYHGTPDQYFSYFTILTNLLIGTWALLAGFLGGMMERRPSLRLALTVYGLVTLAVYWIFLAPNHHPEGPRFFANLGLHLVVPAIMTLESFLVPWPKTTWAAPFWSLGFPVVYGTFVLTLGAFTGWFPYFFLDPGQIGGWTALGLSLAGLLAVFVGLGYGLDYLVRLRTRKDTAQ